MNKSNFVRSAKEERTGMERKHRSAILNVSFLFGAREFDSPAPPLSINLKHYIKMTAKHFKAVAIRLNEAIRISDDFDRIERLAK